MHLSDQVERNVGEAGPPPGPNPAAMGVLPPGPNPAAVGGPPPGPKPAAVRSYFLVHTNIRHEDHVRVRATGGCGPRPTSSHHRYNR